MCMYNIGAVTECTRPFRLNHSNFMCAPCFCPIGNEIAHVTVLYFVTGTGINARVSQ